MLLKKIFLFNMFMNMTARIPLAPQGHLTQMITCSFA